MLAIASARYSKGQMTMEFMAMFPIMVIIACIAVNAVLFFSECAGFDVQAKNAIRTYAASPGYGETGATAGPRIQSALEAEFSSDTTSVSVTSSNQDGGMVRFDATLEYAPNLFGLGLRSSILGVSLPHLQHTTSLVVSPYKPGVLF